VNFFGAPLRPVRAASTVLALAVPGNRCSDDWIDIGHHVTDQFLEGFDAPEFLPDVSDTPALLAADHNQPANSRFSDLFRILCDGGSWSLYELFAALVAGPDMDRDACCYIDHVNK
jgi:hypothetical protein